MRFSVLPARSWPGSDSSGRAFLITDNWDDYTFKTLFRLVYVDSTGERLDIGGVKIGVFGMVARERTALPDHFEAVPETCFSLGQDEAYYEKLNSLGAEVRECILKSLRDIAFDSNLFGRV